MSVLGLIRRILGTDDAAAGRVRAGTEELSGSRASTKGESRISDRYFDSMSLMTAAVSDRDYQTAARLVRDNLRCIPEWVKETVQDYGSFDIRSIPGIQQGGTILALMNDRDGLARMRETVASVPELALWVEEVERHEHDRRAFEAIRKLVAAQPNCLQTDVKGLIGEEDGRRVARLISYLAKAGLIVRIRTGRTYRLLPPDSPDIPKKPQPRTVRSHRTDRRPPRLREIDVESLAYVPLPRSPLRWEE